MAKATVKTRTGAQITIEGSEQEVSDILTRIEGGAGERHKAGEQANPAHRMRRKKRMAAADLILELKAEGFFDKPKGLGEVAAALQERGHLYPTTTLSGVVLRLVKDKYLGRKRAEGKWVYGK